MGGIDGEKQKDSEDYAGARFEELRGRIHFWDALWASVFFKLSILGMMWEEKWDCGRPCLLLSTHEFHLG
ncbi:hypothetical protein PRUPE_4G217300 [Prunus persica]|uniref:Uncharacterized protein n=1 Tax=Prunus persica TaxID=3760 RepID=A0A251PP79_PRUPE|nr:hypothetical protein PRUPE_4G217300 [Prunus persica]